MIDRRLPFCLLVTLFLGACGLSQPYPNRATFVIEPGKTDRLSTPGSTTLCVQGVRIAKPYDTQLFVYKTGPSAFVSDYYAGFIAAPDKLLGAALSQWLNDSGAVKYAVVPGSMMAYSTVLEINVTSLYGDYSDPKKPRAVLELRAFLVNEDPASSRVLLQKLYQESEPLSAAEPARLVEGWNACCRRILTQLAQDIAQAAPASSTQP
jgi:uncharacterized lipoprotein YmbA